MVLPELHLTFIGVCFSSCYCIGDRWCWAHRTGAHRLGKAGSTSSSLYKLGSELPWHILRLAGFRNITFSSNSPFQWWTIWYRWRRTTRKVKAHSVGSQSSTGHRLHRWSQRVPGSWKPLKHRIWAAFPQSDICGWLHSSTLNGGWEHLQGKQEGGQAAQELLERHFLKDFHGAYNRESNCTLSAPHDKRKSH